MAKKELATTNENAQALAAVGLETGLSVSGMEGSSGEVSRLVLFNDTAEEKQAYGRKEWGHWIDALSGESLGPTVRVMPVDGWLSWARWEKGSKAPIYSTKNKADVPPEDLEWNGTEPPAATEALNMIVVVEGQPWPYLLVFKRTGLKASGKVIMPMERRRGMLKKGPGLYELSSVDDKSTTGQPYKRLTAKFIGDPPDAMVQLAVTIKSAIASVKARAEQMADEGGDDGSDLGVTV